MSQWRRTAIEELPCCKTIIEEANSPASLWIHLYDELASAYSEQPCDEKKIQQIYGFALRYARSPQNTYLASGVDIFFQAVIGSVSETSDALGQDVGNRLSASDFARWEPAFSDWFSDEEIADVRKRFGASLHKGKRR